MKPLHVLLLLLSSLVYSATGWSQASTVLVQHPDRGYGYLLGDMVSQTILLPPSTPVNSLTELPAIERVDQWLYRMAVVIEPKPNALIITYQIINSPTQRISIELPAFDLKAGNTQAHAVQSWPISIGPLSPDELPGEGDLVAMQPDITPSIPGSLNARRMLKISAALLVLLTILWLGWWFARNQSENRKLPYALAYQQLKRLNSGASMSSQSGALSDNPKAWQLLHRAFNQSAQRTIHEGTLDLLFQINPWLEPLKSRITKFYSTSSERFFQQSTSPHSFPIIELSKELYRIEKRVSSNRPVSKQPLQD